MALKTEVVQGDAWEERLFALAEGIGTTLSEEDGALVLRGTSFGTNPGDYDNYVNTITLPDQIVGVGAVLMFLAELDGMDAPRPGAFSRTTGE